MVAVGAAKIGVRRDRNGRRERAVVVKRSIAVDRVPGTNPG